MISGGVFISSSHVLIKLDSEKFMKVVSLISKSFLCFKAAHELWRLAEFGIVTSQHLFFSIPETWSWSTQMSFDFVTLNNKPSQFTFLIFPGQLPCLDNQVSCGDGLLTKMLTAWAHSKPTHCV